MDFPVSYRFDGELTMSSNTSASLMAGELDTAKVGIRSRSWQNRRRVQVRNLAASTAGSDPDLGSVEGGFRSGIWQPPGRVQVRILAPSKAGSCPEFGSLHGGFRSGSWQSRHPVKNSDMHLGNIVNSSRHRAISLL